MAKDIYYLRNKLDQDLCAYLEVGETWEDSFLMEFMLSDDAPRVTYTGASYENRSILQLFMKIGSSTYENTIKDKNLEWFPIKPDAELMYVVETLANSFIYNK